MNQQFGNDAEKSSGLKRRRKIANDSDIFTVNVKLFHARVAATANDRSPMVECLVRGTCKLTVVPERRR
jgi:hypothetical protein